MSEQKPVRWRVLPPGDQGVAYRCVVTGPRNTLIACVDADLADQLVKEHNALYRDERRQERKRLAEIELLRLEQLIDATDAPW